MVMRLLGASAPKTLVGRIIGADASPQAAAVELLRNCRRVILSASMVLCRFSCSYLPFREDVGNNKDVVSPCKTITLAHGHKNSIIPNELEFCKANFLAFEKDLKYA